MKRKYLARNALIVLFCAFLGGMAALYALLPKASFSEREKRVLEKSPRLTASSLLSGDFESAFERWMSDHVPGRNALVGLNALYEQLSGRNGLSGVILTRDKRLLAAPETFDERDVRRKCERISALAENTGLPTALMLIPENGYMHASVMPALHAAYRDAEAAGAVADALQGADFLWPQARYEALGEEAELYYRTDHHYTSRGAYEAWRLYAEHLGIDAAGPEAYDVQRVPGFYGSMYAKAGLWAIPPEDIELWRREGGRKLTVRFDDRESADDVFFEEHLSEMDKYPVFLDGNHALVTIEGGEGENLLIVRDSFGHCFAPFAAESFGKIVLADLRYYHRPLTALIEEEQIDRILVLYGMDTFLSDTNFVWMK